MQNGDRDMNNRFCEIVRNGQMQINRLMVGNTQDYFSRLQFQQTICVGENFTYEVRLRNNSTIGGVRAYDVNVLLNTPGGETGCTLMGESWAQSFSKISTAGAVVLQNSPKLVMDLTAWSVLKIQLKNGVYTYFKDNIAFHTTPYAGKVCTLNGFQIIFKGAGAIDWVRVTNDDEGKITYFEDFLNCNQMQLPVNCTPPTIAVSANDPCEGDTLTLSTQTRAAVYEWRGPNGFTSDKPVVVIPKTDLSYGGTYILTAQVNPCIVSKSSVDVRVHTLPIVNLGKDTALCFNNTLTLDGGASHKTYQWQNGATDRYFSVKNSGNYAITVTSTEGCKSADTISVKIANTALQYTSTVKQPLCFGNCTGEIRVAATGGFGAPYAIQWAGGSRELTRTALCAGDYALTIADVQGCTVSNSINIAQPADMTIQAKALEPYQGYAISCAGGTDGQASAQASGGAGEYIYLWKTNPEQKTPIATGLKAGNYTVYIFDKNKCADSAIVSLKAPPQLEATFSTENIRCYGEKNGAIVLNTISGGVQPYKYALNLRPQPDTTRRFSNLNSGDYTFTIKDGNGCSIDQKVTLADPPQLKVNMTADTTIHFGDNVPLFVGLEFPSVLKTVKWTSSRDTVQVQCKACPETSAAPRLPTFFRATITDAFGCEITKEVFVKIDKLRRVFVPNAFSPNEDRQNDFLTIHAGNGIRKIVKFHIFNRWGNLVYAFNNFLPADGFRGWDGTFNGTTAPMDTYVWFAEIEFEDGETEVFRGDVSLVR
jgi:gliding motility-associated-like protein